MSGREFFLKRYAELGWKSADVKVRPSIRVNTLNVDEARLVRRLSLKGVVLEKIPFLKSGFWICKSRFSMGATLEYLLGYYSIQEAASQIPASLFKDLREKQVLDACAAPGGKTVQLANLMGNTGAIVALDVKKSRLAALTNHLERCRVRNTVVHRLDARRSSRLNSWFNRVLLDVPCSGNYAADKGWFTRRTYQDVIRNSELQKQILAESAGVLEDDGEMVYSTCSLEPEENELNIDWAIKTLNLEAVKISCPGEEGLTQVFDRQLDRSIRNCRRIWPGQTQGFFVCKLRKRIGT